MMPRMTKLMTGSSQVQPVRHHQAAAHHHAHAHQRIGEHVQVGAAHVHVALLPAAEQQGRHAIDQNADAGQYHHPAAIHRLGMAQVVNGFPQNKAQRGVEQGRVQQRRLNGSAPVAKGVAPRGRAARQPGRAPGQGQAQHVAQVVAGIGEQRGRVGPQARQWFRQ